MKIVRDHGTLGVGRIPPPPPLPAPPEMKSCQDFRFEESQNTAPLTNEKLQNWIETSELKSPRIPPPPGK